MLLVSLLNPRYCHVLFAGHFFGIYVAINRGEGRLIGGDSLLGFVIMV